MIAGILESIPAVILLTGILVGVSGALLGTFLVVRGSAMLTDAISHSILLGIVLVWMATGARSGPVVVVGAALAGLATVAMTEALARTRRVRTDAAIGLVFPALFALAVLLINLNARNVHIDAHSVLLGEIGFVWLHTFTVAGLEVPVALATMTAMLVINLGFVLLLWKELKIACFDPGLAAALGLAPGLVAGGLLALTSATAVAAFDAVGVILFLAFVIVPPATALLLTDRLERAIPIAAGLATLSCTAGYWLADRWDVSIAGMMATLTGAGFAVALLFGPRQGLLARLRRRGRQRRDADCRILVAHLFSHAGMPEMAEENTARALVGHLRWTPERARSAILTALDRDLVRRHDGLLALTDTGEAMARAIFENRPGRRA